MMASGMVLLGLTGGPVAHAAPDQAVQVAGALSPAEARVRLGWRQRWASGLQAGAEVRLGSAQALYLDGWPVDGGTTLGALGQLSLPLAHSGPVALDLRIDGGPTLLAADEATPSGARSLGARLEVSPLATVALREGLAGQLGWTLVTGLQLQPGFAVDALGQVLVAGGVVALSDSLQLSVRGETGGLYGYNGDGGKYLVRGGVGLRWIPGSADRWLNL